MLSDHFGLTVPRLSLLVPSPCPTPLRHRIMSMPSPGITPADSFCCKVYAFKNSILFDGFFGIYTTSGRIPAGIWQQGRYQVLVNLNEQDERELYDFFELHWQSFEGP